MLSRQLWEQKEECQGLEAALNETCTCLAKALRSASCFETLAAPSFCLHYNDTNYLSECVS